MISLVENDSLEQINKICELLSNMKFSFKEKDINNTHKYMFEINAFFSKKEPKYYVNIFTKNTIPRYYNYFIILFETLELFSIMNYINSDKYVNLFFTNIFKTINFFLYNLYDNFVAQFKIKEFKIKDLPLIHFLINNYIDNNEYKKLIVSLLSRYDSDTLNINFKYNDNTNILQKVINNIQKNYIVKSNIDIDVYIILQIILLLDHKYYLNISFEYYKISDIINIYNKYNIKTNGFDTNSAYFILPINYFLNNNNSNFEDIIIKNNKLITEILKKINKIEFKFNNIEDSSPPYLKLSDKTFYKLVTNSIFYNNLNPIITSTHDRFVNFINNINQNKKANIRIYNKYILFYRYPILSKSLYFLDYFITNELYNNIKCKDIDDDFYKNTLEQCFYNSDSYDILILRNFNNYCGFTSILKSDNLNNQLVYEKHLVCVNSISGIPLGSILQALYLINCKLMHLNIARLSLSGSYRNVDAFCLYDKYGFVPDINYSDLEPEIVNNKYITDTLEMNLDLTNIKIDDILNILIDVNTYLSSTSDSILGKTCRKLYNEKQKLNKLNLNPSQFEDAILSLYNDIQNKLIENSDDSFFRKIENDKFKKKFTGYLINYIQKPIINDSDLKDLKNYVNNLNLVIDNEYTNKGYIKDSGDKRKRLE